MMRGLAWLSAVVLAVVLGGCGGKASPPPPPGVRIVALSPALAVTARDLGLEDRIVGRHAYDLVLDPSLPSCGDQAGIDYEALLRASPTHVLIQWGSRELPARLGALAGERGWVILNYNPLTLEEVRATMLNMALRLGAEESRAAELERAMSAAWRKREGLFAGRVLLLGAADPPSAFGPGSWHDQALRAIGGVPAVVSGSPYITLDAEDVLRLAPDAIVLISPGPRDGPARAWTPKELGRELRRVGALEIPANAAERLALIDDPLAHTPSTAMIGFAEELARVLESWK